MAQSMTVCVMVLPVDAVSQLRYGYQAERCGEAHKGGLFYLAGQGEHTEVDVLG